MGLSETLEAMIRKAVEAQANDETLWAVNISDEPFKVGIGEAYIQQSLRWLHMVIESGDEKALQSIIDQSEDRI